MTEEEKTKIPIVSEEGDYCRWCGVDTELGHFENCPVVLAEKGEEFFEQDSFAKEIEVGWGFAFEPIGEPIFAFHARRVSNFTAVNGNRPINPYERSIFEKNIVQDEETDPIPIGPAPHDKKVTNRLVKEHLKFWREKLGEEGEQYLEKQKEFFEDMLAGELDSNEIDKIDDFLEAERELREIYGGGGDEGGCFVATASLGTPSHPKLDSLREFRDQELNESFFGEKFVEFYYKVSPPFANLISKSEKLRKISREIFVEPLIKSLGEE